MTIDNEHIEVSGDLDSGAATSATGSWRHVAGVYNAESKLLQVWSNMDCVGQATVPPGKFSGFDGPLTIGACCVPEPDLVPSHFHSYCVLLQANLMWMRASFCVCV